MVDYSFNLVIEVLLISRSLLFPVHKPASHVFQSRNRGSFDFKAMSSDDPNALELGCFNLVIEVLLISRPSELYRLLYQEYVSIS